MELAFEIIKFIIYSLAIVYISKQILVKLLRKLAEILNLKAKTVGNIAGFATSVPELLTVFFSSLQGLIQTSTYNIISSNVINFIQYYASIIFNKNGNVLRNKAIKIELGIVIATIIIPILMLITNLEVSITIVPIFILTFIMLYYIRGNAYKVYKIKEIDNEELEKIEEEKKWVRGKKRLAIITSIELVITGVALFVIGNLLGNSLENLSYIFKIPEVIIGIILGAITSVPELITFIESQKHHNKNQESTQGVIEATSNLFTSNMLNLFIIESVGIIVYVFITSF